MEKKVQHTNDSDLTHSMVHYLLTIHKLKEKHGYARVTDIAKDLSLTKGSVSTAVNNLKKKDLVVEDQSKFLSLSQSGHEEVHKILSARTLLFYFLKDVVGVSEESAEKDSCLMEHLVSEETRKKLFQFMRDLSNKNILCERDYKTSIDLSKYDSMEEFLEDQKGDSVLEGE